MTVKWTGTLLALALLGACGGSDSLAGDEGAVNKAAQEQADLYSSGDYAGAYDMWVDSAKELISRDDYAEVGETCDLGGVPIEAKFVRFENDAETEAVVTVGLGDFKTSYTMKLEGGEWSWVPSADAQEQYKLGADGTIAALKEQGQCGD